MANSKSAIKRIQIAERNRLRNKAYKSAVKTLMKRYFTAVESYISSPTAEGKEEVERALSKAYSKIDKAIKRGVLHQNNGSRKKSRLVRFWKRMTSTIQAEATATTAEETAS
ncbi:MAG: 30S ribosomal protein S20 [Spirulina sp.]